MGFTDVVKSIPGLTHYYPLATDARDVVGSLHGTVKGSGVSFNGTHAVFGGAGYIEFPDHNDFSVVTKGGLTLAMFLTISNWKGGGGESEYVHWAGKGAAGAHEYVFRHYVDGGTGEAPARQGRVSFYHFNPAGGLGAGSYVQEAEPTDEHQIAGACDMTTVRLFKDGVQKDADALSGYSIKPQNTTAPFRLGSRGDGTGFLVGRVRRLAVFNRVLSAAELKKLYDARSQAEGGSAPGPTGSALTVPPGGSLADVIKAHNALVAKLKM